MLNKIIRFCFLIFFVFYFFSYRILISDEAENKKNHSHIIIFFDNRTLRSPVITADVEQPVFCTRFLKSTNGTLGDKYFMDMSFGSDAPCFSIIQSENSRSNEILSVNVKGLVRSRFGFKTKSFNLFGNDFYGGISFAVRPEWKNSNIIELYLYHQSSHFGDDYVLTTYTNSVNYSHEVVRVLHSLNIAQNFNLAYGFHYDLRRDVSMPKGRTTLQIDGRYDINLINRQFTLGLDFKSREINKWTPDYSLQAGWKISSGNESDSRHPVQSLIFEYFNGHSNFGQFIQQREEYFLLGIMVNI